MNTTMIIGFIVIFAIVLAAAFVNGSKNSAISAKNKEIAANFLSGTQSHLIDLIKEIASNYDVSMYEDINEVIADLVVDIYDRAWEYIEDFIDNYESDDSTIKNLLLKNFITRSTVEAFIDSIMEKNEDYLSIIQKKWDEEYSEYAKNLVKNDEVLAEEFAKYEDGSKEVDPDLEPIEEEIKEQEIIPQRDEEEVYSDDDISVEELSDGEVEKYEAVNDTTDIDIDSEDTEVE